MDKDLSKLKARIYVESRDAGHKWVPYKILIGYGRGNQVVIGNRGEHLYDSREFSTREAALVAARSRAHRVLAEKFPESAASPVTFDIVEEGMTKVGP